MREVRLHAGSFTRSSLRAVSDREGVPIDALVCRATLYYLADRGSSRPDWRYPEFLRESRRDEGGMTIRLDDDVLDAAASEADSQGVAVERLLEHAALYFLAALEAGRAPGAVDDVARNRQAGC